jgi:hypothetical protein
MRTNASGLGLGFRAMPKRMTKAGSPPFNARYNLAGKPLPTLRDPSPVTIRFECPRCRGPHPAYECREAVLSAAKRQPADDTP